MNSFEIHTSNFLLRKIGNTDLKILHSYWSDAIMTEFMKYLGLMRAIGMAGPKLRKMVLTESATYSLAGLAAGSSLGLALQKWLVQSGMAPFHMTWHFPWLQITGIALFTGIITIVSELGPIKKIKNMPVTELVGSL